MKRIFVFLMLFIGTAAVAHTINWYVDGNIFHTTTCESGEDITPPTAPEKYGYTFKEWLSYTPIEYLETNGAQQQYIDTGYIPNNNTGIEIKIQNMAANTNDNTYFFGAGESAQIRSFESYTWAKQMTFNYDSNNSTNSLPDREPFIIKWNKNHIQYTDPNYDYTYILPDKIFTAPYTMYLLALHRPKESATIVKLRIYYAKIYDNDFLIRDFIPVLDKNGTPCLLDLVEKKFYYNAGTGDFIAGPVIGE